MFEYFNLLGGAKKISIGGMDINLLLLIAAGAIVAIFVVYSLMRMTK